MPSPSPLLRSLILSTLVATAAGAATTTSTTSVVGSAPPSKPAPAPIPPVGSYDVGLMLGIQLQHDGLSPVLSMDDLLRGLKDGIAGKASTPEEREGAVAFSHATRDTLAEHNQAEAKAFLDRNAKQPGIVAMPSGLQYRVLAEGDPAGTPPRPTDQVTVRYRASLADGTEFDRSDSHDRPATFKVNSVFKGWQEAFAAMKPGAKWQLFVPPDLGYGANSPPMVPPGSLLVYEIELLKVEAGKPLDPAAAVKVRPSGGPKPAKPR